MKIPAYFAVLYTCLAMSFVIPAYSYLSDLYMNENCGNMNYPLASDAVLLKYDLYNTYYSCKFVLETTNYGEMFIVKAIKVNFAVDDCSNDYVIIQNGDQTGSILEELCGNYVPGPSYVTSDSWLTLDYEVSNFENSFQLLITKFTNGDCEEDDTFLCNNGRCIASSLACDGWNNCGDNSDETQGCITSSPSPDVYMNKHCGDTSYIVKPPAIFLRYPPNSEQYSCKFVLETEYGSQMFIVKAIDVDFVYPECDSDYVTIQDGYFSGVVLKKFCKTRVPRHAYTTITAWLTLDYETTQPSGNNNFRLLVTKYTDGPCTEGSEFKCDNGRCIDSTLMCDQWDNCGDNSDETRGCKATPYLDFTPALIAAITIGSAGLLMLFVTLVILIVRRNRRRPAQPQSQPPSYGSISPNAQGYTPVPPPTYEKINSGNDATGTGNADVTPRNPSVNP